MPRVPKNSKPIVKGFIKIKKEISTKIVEI